ncbi:MAG: MarR family transcriptional regulator [Candidatus Omnitrophica bacterium]|nr:MarR family transcriptional regulator [Candidatus Omnitrophota bacterium]
MNKGADLSDFAEEMVQSLSLIHKASHTMLKSRADAFTKGKITFPQYILLELLYTKGPIKMKDIASSLGISLPAATGMVDRLISLNKVKRVSDPADRRVIIVQITSTGTKAVVDIISFRKKLIEKMFSGFTDSERQTYLKLIRKVRRTIDER